jgi:REP element-mobilizing transposase RayT
MEKYQNKYRIPSARLQTWNYGANAPYFVTICTHGRECFFGKIVVTTNSLETPKLGVSTKLGVSNTLSPIGQLAQKYWDEIPNHFPFVKLGAFVVMPNHVHGIIIIDKPGDLSVETPNLGVSTTLGNIINQYKRAVTIGARHINPVFAWQSRFHDHIIRDDRSFQNISNYINRNPQNWKGDKFCN